MLPGRKKRWEQKERKALSYRWTKAWRRAHKKETVLKATKKMGVNKETMKSERGVVGLSIQDLMRKRDETADEREKMRKAAAQRKANQAKGPPVGKKAKKDDLKRRLAALKKKKAAEAKAQAAKQSK